MLVLRAVCALPAGTLLTGDLSLLGADAEELLLAEGPEAAAAAAAHLAPGACNRCTCMLESDAAVHSSALNLHLPCSLRLMSKRCCCLQLTTPLGSRLVR